MLHFGSSSQPEMIFPHGGHLKVSGDIFDCHNLRGTEKAASGIGWVEAREANSCEA